MEKDINLLNLHRNMKVWITAVINLHFNELISTTGVGNHILRVDNLPAKKNGKKFSTYQQHIILHHFIFFLKNKRIINK